MVNLARRNALKTGPKIGGDLHILASIIDGARRANR